MIGNFGYWEYINSAGLMYAIICIIHLIALTISLHYY